MNEPETLSLSADVHSRPQMSPQDRTGEHRTEQDRTGQNEHVAVKGTGGDSAERFAEAFEKVLKDNGIPYERSWAWEPALRELISDNGEDSVRRVIAHWKREDFWRDRIRSPAKLAQHWDELAYQARRDGGGGPKRSRDAADWPAIEAHYRDLFARCYREDGDGNRIFDDQEDIEDLIATYRENWEKRQ